MAIAKQYPHENPNPAFASQAQINYICDLLDDRNLFAMPGWFDQVNAMDIGEYTQYLEDIKAKLPQVSKPKASDMIAKLRLLPKKEIDEQRSNDASTAASWQPYDHFARGKDNGPGSVWAMAKDIGDTLLIVPRGSYALRNTSDTTNTIAFYSVWISDDGSRWTVRRYESDERVRIPRSQQYTILERIAANPEEAAALYGHEIGKCGICGRKLTNDVSRERGIGPVCAERWGW